jgi:ParB family transcriptional regulator, chromosome partitioning protein
VSKKKKGLGRNFGELGLSELLGGISPVAEVVPDVSDVTSVDKISNFKPSPEAALNSKDAAEDRVFRLAVSKLHPGRFQPRQFFNEDALNDLASSIRAHGIIQPLVVRRAHDGYEIIAGERRWRAAQRAGLEQVPAIIQDLPEQAMVAIALIENIQREDLNPLEEATALDRLLNEFGLTHQEVADAVGKSRAAVTNLLRLLKLSPDVKQLLETSAIDMGHARALLSLDPASQSEVAHLVVSKGLSVRQTEQYVRDLSRPEKPNVVEKRLDPNISSLQGRLSDQLGAKVVLRHQSKGKGQLVIHYNSVDELDGILEHIK